MLKSQEKRGSFYGMSNVSFSHDTWLAWYFVCNPIKFLTF